MDIINFLDLTDEQQIDILWDDGTYLETYNTYHAEYQLFSLYSFFVELTLTPEGRGIQQLSIFNSGERLDKYSPNLKLMPKPWD